MESVQGIRARKRVPGGMVLHDYACLYICARNPMLFKRCQAMRDDLCVLAFDPAVLDIPDVVIADHNAALGHSCPTSRRKRGSMISGSVWRCG